MVISVKSPTSHLGKEPSIKNLTKFLSIVIMMGCPTVECRNTKNSDQEPKVSDLILAFKNSTMMG